MKRFRSHIFLALILCVLVAIANWEDHLSQEENAAKQEYGRVIPNNSKFVTKIELNVQSQPKIVLITSTEEQTNGGKHHWNIIQPLQAAADKAIVQNLLKTLSDYRFSQEIDLSDTADLKDFGLERPAIWLKINFQDGTTTTIKVGTNTPFGYDTYLSSSHYPKEVLVGSQYLRTSVSKTLFDLRDKSAIPFTEIPVNISVFRPENRRVVLDRALNSRDWRLTSAAGLPIDPVKISAFIQELKNLKVLQFLDNPSEKMRDALHPKNTGTTPIGKIKLVYGNEKERSFTILENSGKSYAIEDKKALITILDTEKVRSVFSYDNSSFTKLQPFPINSDSLIATTIGPTRLVKDKKTLEWKNVTNTGKSDARLDLFLFDLELLHAKSADLEPPPEIAPTKPSLTLKLEMRDGQTTNAMFWQTANMYIIKRDDSPLYFQVDRDEVSHFPTDLVIAKSPFKGPR